MVVISAEHKTLIENTPVALATVDNSANPNVIPVASVKVVAKNKILITDNFMKQTRNNILANPHVCIAVWNKDSDGVKIIGEATYYSAGKWKDYVKQMPENKDLAAKGAIIITIKNIFKLC